MTKQRFKIICLKILLYFKGAKIAHIRFNDMKKWLQMQISQQINRAAPAYLIFSFIHWISLNNQIIDAYSVSYPQITLKHISSILFFERRYEESGEGKDFPSLRDMAMTLKLLCNLQEYHRCKIKRKNGLMNGFANSLRACQTAEWILKFHILDKSIYLSYLKRF